jgi:hypothetical protein
MAVAMVGLPASQGASSHRTTRGRATVVVLGVRGGRPDRLNRNTYMTVTAALFLIMAIAHLLRIIFEWQVQIGGLSIPFWVSWLAFPVAVALAYFGFMQKR